MGIVNGDDMDWRQVANVEGQLELLPDTAVSPARHNDPETAHEAAALPHRRGQRWRVLCTLLDGPLHDEGIAHKLSMDKGSASKRRGELVEAGLVEWADTYTRTTAGSRARVWRLTEAGKREARRD